MLMEPEHRQLVLLVVFMTLLTATVLFVFVYAPNPAETVYPNTPSFEEIGSFLLEKFNIFNYFDIF